MASSDENQKWRVVEYFPDEREQKALRKRFSFKDFEEAMAFVNKVGELAEKANHHPDINLGWGYVQVWLTTHSESKITDKDHDLAVAIDQILE